MSEMKDRPDMRGDAAEGGMPTERPVDRSTERRPADRPMDRNANGPMDRQRTATEPVRATGEHGSPQQTAKWPEMSDYGQRFHELESEFIEDPKAAVMKAEQLMEEALQKLTKSMQDKMQSMHSAADGKDGDTEMLRQKMRDYRTWIERMGGRKAA